MKSRFEEWKACAVESVRAEPMKTAGLALLAGIFLSGLSVAPLARGLVRLAMALLRPALLIFGVVKLVEEFEKRNKA